MSAITIELPEGIHKNIDAMASKHGFTVNQFLAAAASEKLEVMAGIDYLRQEAQRGSREGFERFLAAVPDVPPEPSDVLP